MGLFLRQQCCQEQNVRAGPEPGPLAIQALLDLRGPKILKSSRIVHKVYEIDTSCVKIHAQYIFTHNFRRGGVLKLIRASINWSITFLLKLPSYKYNSLEESSYTNVSSL